LELDPLFAGCLPSKPLTGIDWRKADGTRDHPAWASLSVPIETRTEQCIGKYDPVVFLALNPIRDESIILSGTARSTGTFRRLPAEQATATGSGIDWGKADGTKDHPVWASVPIETEPSKYDLVVLLALSPITGRDESITILSGTARDRISSLALACPLCLGRLHVERSLGGLPFDCAAYHVGPGLADFHG
jgi:hypothetical protein